MTLEGSFSLYFSLSLGLLIMVTGSCSAIIIDISEINYFTYNSTDADVILSEMQYIEIYNNTIIV